MDESKRNYGARAVLGTFLVLIGGLYLLKSLEIIELNIPHIIFSGPFILFIVGLLILVNSRKKILGTIMMVVGGVWLIPRLFPWIDIDGGIIVSIAIIGLGLYIILKHRNRSYLPEESTNPSSNQHRAGDYSIRKDYIDDVAIFGGGQRVVYSEGFKGGNITAIFGGSEIDLTNCKLAEGTNIIEILAIFGGAEIHVPRDWHVIVNATPIFGGFSNKIIREPGLPVDLSRTLLIKGLAMFGGIEINSKKN